MKRSLILLTAFLVCMLVSQNAMAKSSIGLRSLGAEVGYVSPEDIEGTIGFAAFADLGTFAPRWRLVPRVSFWSSSEEEFGAEVALRDIAFGARGQYMFRVKSRKLQPYAGGGLGLHMLKAEVTIPEQDLGGGMIIPEMHAEDSATKIGLELGGGVIKPLNPKTDFLADLWYGIVDNASTLSIKVGFSFKLNR